ncbi:MAG: cupredoxin domain-containing protein [Anaerolineales bacterium]|nr:cupredoxin domain-containing protein [Anaerolineales bacterium]
MSSKVSKNPASASKALVFSIFIIATLLVAFTPLPIPQDEPTDRIIQVDASTFAFTPAEIKVNQGDQVTIELTSSDVVHGLYLDGYNLQLTIDPGQTNEISFIADQSGSFRFRCSVTCGDLHPFMIGKLHVGTNLLLWRGVGLAVLAALAGVWGYNQ